MVRIRIGLPVHRGSHPVVSVSLAFVIGVSGLLAASAPALAAAAENPPRHSAGPWLDLAASLASMPPVRALLDIVSPEQVSSHNGRTTVLLLGSDTRGGGVGRTDTIMVVSVKDDVISAASIPRDTSHIPNPFKPGTLFKGRVNAILKQLKRQYGSTEVALDKFEIVIEKLLDIQIDYHALITFRGFNALVDVADPITVSDTHGPIKDKKFWDDANRLSGVYFPAASTYPLYASDPNTADGLCNGLWRNHLPNPPAQYWCHHALPFVRTRKGPGNSDFRRALRQQVFVNAAITRMTGPDAPSLDGLRDQAVSQVGAGQLNTNIPLTASIALDFYDLLKNSSLDWHVVFSPPTYAKHIKGTTAYRLVLPNVRAWTAAHMS